MKHTSGCCKCVAKSTRVAVTAGGCARGANDRAVDGDAVAVSKLAQQRDIAPQQRLLALCDAHALRGRRPDTAEQQAGLRTILVETLVLLARVKLRLAQIPRTHYE